MSVHAQIVPDWSRHALAEKFAGAIKAQARQLGLGDDDAEDVAESIAVGLCLEGQFAGDLETIERRFITRCKSLLWKRKAKRTMEQSVDGLFDTVDMSEANKFGYLSGTVVQANQVDYVYVRELLRFLDKLPNNHRRVMKKLALGMSPLEIAQREQADVSAILVEIKTARDWIIDHEKWGE